jgi:hypothetical protein
MSRTHWKGRTSRTVRRSRDRALLSIRQGSAQIPGILHEPIRLDKLGNGRARRIAILENIMVSLLVLLDVTERCEETNGLWGYRLSDFSGAVLARAVSGPTVVKLASGISSYR